MPLVAWPVVVGAVGTVVVVVAWCGAASPVGIGDGASDIFRFVCALPYGPLRIAVERKGI